MGAKLILDPIDSGLIALQLIGQVTLGHIALRKGIAAASWDSLPRLRLAALRGLVCAQIDVDFDHAAHIGIVGKVLADTIIET